MLSFRIMQPEALVRRPSLKTTAPAAAPRINVSIYSRLDKWTWSPSRDHTQQRLIKAHIFDISNISRARALSLILLQNTRVHLVSTLYTYNTKQTKRIYWVVCMPKASANENIITQSSIYASSSCAPPTRCPVRLGRIFLGFVQVRATDQRLGKCAAPRGWHSAPRRDW